MMCVPEIASAVRTVRLNLADYLDGLDDADWTVPSLCSAWTVREVVVHLTLTTRATIPFLLRSAIRARGSVDRMKETIARERAARFPTAELVAQLHAVTRQTVQYTGPWPLRRTWPRKQAPSAWPMAPVEPLRLERLGGTGRSW